MSYNYMDTHYDRSEFLLQETMKLLKCGREEAEDKLMIIYRNIDNYVNKEFGFEEEK